MLTKVYNFINALLHFCSTMLFLIYPIVVFVLFYQKSVSFDDSFFMAFYFVFIMALYILTLVIKNDFIFLRLFFTNLFWWIAYTASFSLFAFVPKLYNVLQIGNAALYFHIALPSLALFVFIINVLMIVLAKH